MAQTGYTPISLYYSATSGNTPSAGNLANGELAINTADGILFYKNSGGSVVPLSSTGGLSWQAVQTTSFTAAGNKAYPVNTTSGAVTVTLPASPTAGQAVGVLDYAGTWATYNCIINPNGGKIQGVASNVSLNINREAVTFVYVNSTQGWLPYSGFNATVQTTYPITYLAVGGGSGSSNHYGGSAGQVSTGTLNQSMGTVLTIVVGAGGAPSTAGGTTSINSLVTSVGGNPGGTSGNGFNVGSGDGTAAGGGAGSTRDGYPGGSSAGGAGGDGTTSSISGASVVYAGGGGSEGQNSGGAGAAGGGNGGYSSAGLGTGPGTNAAANTGSGAGGGGQYSGGDSGQYSGGSGIVILSMPTASYTGLVTGSPTVSTFGSNTIVKFTSSGSYTV